MQEALFSSANGIEHHAKRMSPLAKPRRTLNDQPWRVPTACVALAGISFAVFGQTVTHEFVDFDDGDYVYSNSVVSRGLTRQGFVWAFTQTHSANWHPLTWLSHMLDCQLYGLNPAGHHLTNVLLHSATVIALFLVLWQMTSAFWRSAFIAAVFAIHPLRVESVAWVAERKDVLSGLFFMLTIGAYVRYARRPSSPVCYGLVAFLFSLGLMCKPMLVTLPVVLLLLDYWPLRRSASAGRLVAEKLPLLALSAGLCVVTLLAQDKAMASMASISVPLRIANALATCMVYLRQMVWPVGLAVFYPYPYSGLPAWEVAESLAGALLAGFSVVAWTWRGNRPWLLVGWLWYLVMLLPVLGLIQVGQQAHSDRYTYLPQIGIYIALTWLIAEWRVSRTARGCVMAGVLTVLTVCACKQVGYWRNSEILWSHTLACTTGNSTAHYNLGSTFQQKGRVDEATAQYEKALQINPYSDRTHYNLGNILSERGRVDEAIAHYEIALQSNPNYAEAHVNLGIALCRTGRVDEGIIQYREALKINPAFAIAHNNLGNALLEKGMVNDAITEYQKAIEADPLYALVRFNLGNIFLEKGRVDEAIAQYQKALQIDPAYANVQHWLGIAFGQKGREREAISHLQSALQIEPSNMQIQNDLAWHLATCPEASLRNGKKSLELARQANDLAGGGNPIILQILAAACAEVGQFNDAKRNVQKAIELAPATGRQDLLEQLNNELKFYEAGRSLNK